MPASSILDSIVGGLLGVAAGDALGATVEFMYPSEIKRRHGVHRDIIGGGPFGWRPGEGTDDTDLTWAVVSGYLQSGGANSATVISSIGDEFLAWFDTFPRDVGGTTSRALLRLRDRGDPATSGLTGERSCGNGSLMRALPTALIRRDPARRRTESERISAITHAHPRCIDSCVAYNEIAAALLEGHDVAEAIAAARGLELNPDVQQALETPGDLPIEQVRTSGYVIDSLSCAVWAIQQPDTLESVLVSLINRGRDSDTTGAIAGGLLGVMHGKAAIPRRWQTRLEYAGKMMEAAAEIHRIRIS